MIQAYGLFNDYNSIASVGRAIVNELIKKHIDVTVYSTNTMQHVYKDIRADVALRNSAPIGLYIGYPENGPGWLEGHAFKIMVTVCETDRIPQSWVDACNFCDLVVVPSQWCYNAFKNSGVTKKILKVNHGIYSEIARQTRALPKGSGKYFLHVSGSLSFAARKGTSKLLRAYRRLVDVYKDFTPKLYLKMPNTEGVVQAIELLNLKEHTVLLPDASLSPIDMYSLQRNALAVVQPSRAEGFGIVPLESRAVGTPIIMTNDTGHCEHCVTGVDLVVPTSRLYSLLETQANPVGSAPNVAEEDIYTTMVRVLSCVDQVTLETTSWANKFSEIWDWSNVLTPLVREIKSIAPEYKKQGVKLGGAASLRGTE